MQRDTVCRSMKTNLRKCWWRGHDSTLHLKPEWCIGGGGVELRRRGKKSVSCFIDVSYFIDALSSFQSRYSRAMHRMPLGIKKPFLLAHITEQMTPKLIPVLFGCSRVEPPQGLLTEVLVNNNCLKFSHFSYAKERLTALCIFHPLPLTPCSF